MRGRTVGRNRMGARKERAHTRDVVGVAVDALTAEDDGKRVATVIGRVHLAHLDLVGNEIKVDDLQAGKGEARTRWQVRTGLTWAGASQPHMRRR